MKLSTYYKKLGFHVALSKDIRYIKADKCFASTVFNTNKSQEKVVALKSIYKHKISIGGSGFSLNKRLLPEVESCFPDYHLHNHHKYALGFLTRGCNKRSTFCLVPKKEGKTRKTHSSFSNFVSGRQRNFMLLNDNLLAFPGVEDLLSEMIFKKYAVNFSQTLDITYVNQRIAKLLKKIDSRNSKFTKSMIYFSCNNIKNIKQFIDRKNILKSFGKNNVTVITMFGFNNTRLSEDYKIFIMLRKLNLIPFFQEYFPITGVPVRVPENFFDTNLNEVIRLTFRSNGQN